MAVLRNSRKPIKETIDRFFGLNLTGETQLIKGESPNMTNCYITDNYDLDKMYGYAQLMKTIGTYSIRGMWHGTVGGIEHFLFACNGHIYKTTNGYWDDDSTWEKTNAFTTHCTDLGTLTDATTRFFDFGGKVYFQNGVEYKGWTGTAPATVTMSIANPCVVTLNAHGFTLNQAVRFTTTGALPTGLTAGTTYYVIPVDTNTFRLATSENGAALETTGTQSGTHTIVPMFSTVMGHIPKVFIGCKPSTGAGMAFDVLNQLTGKKHMTFHGDTTATYKLSETSVASIDYVYVGGTLKAVTTDYTVDLTAGTVTFGGGKEPANGLDNVDIYWTKANNDRTVVTNNKACVEFKNRIFMYGNATLPNIFQYSDLSAGIPSAEYFPALNFQPVGKSNTAITDISVSPDSLVITKPNSAYFAVYNSYVLDGLDVINFPVSNLSSTTGNIAFAQGQIIDNYPLTIEAGLQQWTQLSFKDEKNAHDISMRIKEDLNDLDLSTALTIDFQERSEYWLVIGKALYIYNYGLYGFENGKTIKGVFSRITLNDTPTCFMNIEGEIYFGTTAGLIMKCSPNYISFNGVAIEEHWESGFMDFGANFLSKTLDKVWIGLQPQLSSEADIDYITNIKVGENPETISNLRQIFMLGEVDFSDFSFSVSANPQPKKIKLKAKGFTYLKITVDNVSLTKTCKILNMTLNVTFSGESK